jgi:Methyltransferase domain
MNRLTIIRALMDQKKLRNYLEIGVFNGVVFFRVKSWFKIAVDPEFAFDTARKIGKTIVNPFNLFSRYFKKTSDDFFALDAGRIFAKKKIELALVDGMHEYAFALRDVENSLKYLADDGVILMHDCNPQKKEQAGTFEEWRTRGSGDWNGDVWKAVLHLRSTRDDIHVFVLDCDYGLGVITKGKPENKLSYTPSAIQAFTYEDFEANRQSWLNLKPADYFYEYFKVR